MISHKKKQTSFEDKQTDWKTIKTEGQLDDQTLSTNIIVWPTFWAVYI
jgi:hypothetical protein